MSDLVYLSQKRNNEDERIVAEENNYIAQQVILAQAFSSCDPSHFETQAIMAPRGLPFTAFVDAEASDPDGCVTLFGAVGVTGVSIVGEYVYEKRQVAAVSWEETDETIHSLEICSAVDFGRRQVSLDAADLRFKNQPVS